jgi:hypothetical protein
LTFNPLALYGSASLPTFDFQGDRIVAYPFVNLAALFLESLSKALALAC